MLQKTATEIQARFLYEQANIRRFIVTADEYTQLNDDAVNHVAYLLKMNGVRDFFSDILHEKGNLLMPTK